MKVRAFACGSRSRGRSIFTHNSVWGAPYQVCVFASQLDPKTHRITDVRLVAKNSGTVITLSRNESRSESADSVLTVFESQEVTFPYADYWVDFAIEERGVAPSASHRLSLDRDYREFWASDFIDAIMSV